MLLFVHPPTAKTDYRRNLIFGMHTHQVATAGPIEAILDICPPSRVRGVSRGTLGGDKNEQNFFPNFSIFSIGLVSLGCLHLRISIHDATTPVLDHFLSL